MKKEKDERIEGDHKYIISTDWSNSFYASCDL